MQIENPDLEVLLPVHNEAASIESVMREIYTELSGRLRLQFIVCEDGSQDDTKEVLTRLSREVPMKLIMSDERKGYSRAVRDGMRELSAPYLLCLDSDGQCDPEDFWQIWAERDRCDVVLGWRVQRADILLRRLLSRTFYWVYELFYSVPVHDPSCPYVLVPKRVIEKLVGELGEMQQGFWWEFIAQVHRRGFSIRELPVHHRRRVAGTTQVYQLKKMPGIGYRHGVALFKIWLQTRSR